MSLAERDAWRALRRLRAEGAHFVRRHKIGRYTVDFAARKQRIAVEIDGGVHDLPGRREADAKRQAHLERIGWRVIHIAARNAGNADYVLNVVRTALLTPSPPGEGAGGGAPRDRAELGAALDPARRTGGAAHPAPQPPPLEGRGLREKLIAQIRQTGPLRVDQYMAACLYDAQHGYYARAPRIGAEGDFLTAPEASQMFGELIGLWCAHEWDGLGRPAPLAWIELGPGNGALMADAWRAARLVPAFQRAAQLSLLEVSGALRARQIAALAQVGARCAHPDRFEAIAPGPSLIVANEFLDCLPIRQFVRGEDGRWRERLIGLDENGLCFGLSAQPLAPGEAAIPPALADAAPGAVAEHAPGLAGWVEALAARLHSAPGRALLIDYGGDGAGDTLQALRGHAKEAPLAHPGAADLTAHVDFSALTALARGAGLQVAGPVPQGAFLAALGLAERARALASAHPERAERIGREVERLAGAGGMGRLFQAVCLSSPRLPAPSGF